MSSDFRDIRKESVGSRRALEVGELSNTTCSMRIQINCLEDIEILSLSLKILFGQLYNIIY